MNVKLIKKESPNEGTETRTVSPIIDFFTREIKKESPNEGTETHFPVVLVLQIAVIIKKESPNEGTETKNYISGIINLINKKRIPE